MTGKSSKYVRDDNLQRSTCRVCGNRIWYDTRRVMWCHQGFAGVNYHKAAPPVAKIEDIGEKRTAPLLKDASDVTGIWDLTGGIDPVEHVRRMRE